MISTTWNDAPTGFSGAGADALLAAAACPAVAGGAVIRMAPIAAPIQESGLPVAIRLRPIDERGVTVESYLSQAPVAAGTALMSATTHDFGTTLGIHSPGRPQS